MSTDESSGRDQAVNIPIAPRKGSHSDAEWDVRGKGDDEELGGGQPAAEASEGLRRIASRAARGPAGCHTELVGSKGAGVVSWDSVSGRA